MLAVALLAPLPARAWELVDGASKDHTRAELLEVRSQEPLFLASLPEQGLLNQDQSCLSAYELTNKSKAEAPHLVVIRAGIREFSWTAVGDVLELPSWSRSFVEIPYWGKCITQSAQSAIRHYIYLLIRNLRI